MMNKAYYFSHDYNARNDPKLLKVRQAEDWWGYGLYWALVEILYEQGGYILQEDLGAVAFDLRVDLKRLGQFFDAYPDLFLVTEQHITNESVLRRIAHIKAKSEINSKNAKEGWDRRKKKKKRPQSKPNADAFTPEFETFWTEYHKQVGIPKTDKDPAFKYWKKMNKADKIKAIEKIMAYADSVKENDPQYRKKARTYLGDKSYNNEFEEPRKLALG